MYYALAKISSHRLAEHSIVDERAPSRLCVGYSLEAGDFLTAIFCHDTSHQLLILILMVPPHHAIPGSRLRPPSTEGPPSCLLARPQSIQQMQCRHFPALPLTPPQRSSLSYFSGFGGRAGAFSHGARGGRARVLIDVFVCVCVSIKLHITAQSGPVILVILCHSH